MHSFSPRFRAEHIQTETDCRSTLIYLCTFGYQCDAPTCARCEQLLSEVKRELDSLKRLAERDNRLYQLTCQKTCKRLDEKLHQVYVLLTRPSRI